ncbi:MAG: Uma2 family endonuclease [Acidobacteria bacterium]|nr:Uma2 family endonuclease [Acidobacteriota bacterium]
MSEPGRDRLLTYADYAALPDDGHRYQLLNAWHQEVLLKLASRLLDHVEGQGLGGVFAAPLDVTLSDRNVLQPDILFISRERAGILQGGRVLGAPDLCVEILSPGTERIDRVRKLELYARFDVTHYWIVDLAARTIEEYALSGDVYRVRSITGYDEPFRPAVFPGFEFRLSVVPLPDGL